MPGKRLAGVTVRGKRRPRLALPRRLATPAAPIAGRPVARRRTFTFSFGTGADFTALIDGKAFDPSAIGVTPRLGTIEEWTLRNSSSEDHPFHIHVNDFQVMSVNGKAYRARRAPRRRGDPEERWRGCHPQIDSRTSPGTSSSTATSWATRMRG